MRVTFNTGINFKRRLLPSEEADFSAVLKDGKTKLGNTGHSMLIVPSSSLPQEINTGVGNLLDKEGKNFIDFAKLYWGINYIQLLPEGKYRAYNYDEFLPYSGSSLDLGEHLINPELLTTKNFGNILTQEDISEIVNSNKNKETLINFENILNEKSATDKALRKAYKELIKADSLEKKELLVKLEKYSQTNKEWLEPKAIYEALSHKYNSRDTRNWNKFDHNFYNTDVVSLKERTSAIEGIMNSELGNEARFYKFKQFLADEHLAMARKDLNKKGVKLSGDMLAGYSFDEVWANPKAFVKNSTIGWGIPALDLDTPEAEKLLRTKVNNYAKRYDGIRLDASWTYVNQPVKNNLTGVRIIKEYDSKILEIIEDEIKKVKGLGYDFENIMQEFVAEPKDFDLFHQGEIKPVGKNRTKIFTSDYLTSDWGNVSAYKKRNWDNGSYILGATNHDSVPMKILFQNSLIKDQQAEVLSKLLKIPKEDLNTTKNLIQAKLAEPMRSKHNMIFFTDALNISERYKDNPTRANDYRIKIPKNYQKEYFKALENGEAFNVMDALDKAFVAEGLDKTESKLYNQILKYKKILQSPEKTKISLNNWKLWATGIALGLVFGILCLKKRKPAKTGPNAQ